MIELTSKQRKALEAYAQPLSPVVMVGQNGVTPAVETMTDASLAAHELIKVKFLEFKDDRRELSIALAEKCNATLVRVIGNIAILYREAEKQQNRHYPIPQ